MKVHPSIAAKAFELGYDGPTTVVYPTVTYSAPRQYTGNGDRGGVPVATLTPNPQGIELSDLLSWVENKFNCFVVTELNPNFLSLSYWVKWMFGGTMTSTREYPFSTWALSAGIEAVLDSQLNLQKKKMSKSNKLTNPHQMILGYQYKIIEPDYDNDGTSSSYIVEVLKILNNSLILKDVTHNFTFERYFKHLMDCEIETVLDLALNLKNENN